MKKIIKKILRKLLSFFIKKNELTKKEIKSILNTKNPVILEIGSADGGDTLDFIKTFSDVNLTLYGFEPEPKNITILENKIPYSNYKLFKGVISDIDGELSFNRSRTDNPEDISLSGSIMNPKKHLELWDWIHFDEKLTVPSITLDTFSKQNNLTVIDFIWCDVQGAEKKVIIGGQETLKNNVRFFYTEYSNDEQYEGQPTKEEILNLLPSFEVVNDYGTDILLKNRNI